MIIHTVRIVGFGAVGSLEVQFQTIQGDNLRVHAHVKVSEIVQEVGDLITLWMHHDSRFRQELENYLSGKDVL